MIETIYGVAYISDSTQELKVGDRVVVIDEKDNMFEQYATVSALDKFYVTIQFAGGAEYQYNAAALRKLPDTISSEKDSDNMKAFKAILNEMAETYKVKDATYGNAYQDGFNRFGAVQLVSRMYEKYCRIENLLVRNADNKVPDESVIDTITDLGVQAICLRMLLQKNDFENVG